MRFSLTVVTGLLWLACVPACQESEPVAEPTPSGGAESREAGRAESAATERREAPTAPADPAGEETLSMFLVPGVQMGPVKLGMTYLEVIDMLGEPDSAFPFQRIITLTYKRYGLQVVVTSSNATQASDDALVCSLATQASAELEGDFQHGMSRDEVEARLGEPLLTTRGVSHFPTFGLAVKFDDEEQATQFALWEPYEPQVDPPEMLSAQTEMPEPLTSVAEGEPVLYAFEGESFEVVDMHLHTGSSASMHPDGVSFLLSALPAPTVLNFPATSERVRDPYDPHVGIKEHLRDAGVGHGVLLATYTHHTIGYTPNRVIEAMLDDARNVNPDGSRWSWGMASINFEGYEEPGVAEARLEALASYFQARPDLFIGIKLAHAHQAVSFDDPAFLGVYDIAAEYDVPVLLHTGFSPFPHTMDEPHYYDPASLEAVIEAYDGNHGQPKVEFVLAHAGQGDARAIESSLRLAQLYDNVWLELSAIHRPLLVDLEGQEVSDTSEMHLYVLSEIKARGVIDRAIYATDGPQYFGKSQSYLDKMVKAMKDAGYTQEELRAVLAANFYTCYQAQRF